jgi:NAD(P)-dependent dehydrogenase (short-subunit alcohol dehydrogenase family)
MLQSLFGLGGKVALVTGGGAGIGRAVSEALVEAGAARVYIASRKAAALEQAAAISRRRAAARPWRSS